MAGYISMDSVSDIKLNGVDVEMIAQGANTLWEKSAIEPFNVKNISQSVATVDWNTGSDNRNLEYSEDKTTWTSVPYANGKYTLTIPVGKKYYVHGSSTNFGGWWGSDQDVEIGGYVLSLHYPTMVQPSNQGVSYQKLFSKNGNGTADSKLHFNFSKLKLPVLRVNTSGYEQIFDGCLSITSLNSDIFYTEGGYSLSQTACRNMFRNCKNLTRVDGFTLSRFINLANWSQFTHMFDGCTGLEYVWDGLFDTEASNVFFRDSTCAGMFYNCTSLTHPPKLPNARGNKSFTEMFRGCTSLTNATTDRIMPTYSSIGTQSSDRAMTEMFKGMFYGCTGLTSMHDISSYTMGNRGMSYFYQMYYGCTGITSVDANKMPGGVAVTNCFREMFRGCTGITSVPSGFIKPTNTAENCYQEMFRDCTGLTTIPTGLLTATTFAKNCCVNMFYNCTHLTAIPSGFMSPTTVGESCCQSMFEGCSVLTTIPSGLLPALTMAKNCYSNMFRSCSSLANVPYDLLPATTVAEGCYSYMFQYSNHGFTGLHLGATDIGTSAFANWMFFDCPISQLEVDFKEWTAATTDWVLRTSNSGTFTKYEMLPEIYDTSHIPNGWTVVNKYSSESPTITHDAFNIIIVNNTYNDGGVIYYTTDGSTPTSGSSVYSQPFPAVLGQTVKAICIYHDIVSDVASWTVVATQLPEPTITGMPSSVTITNNDTIGGSAIYYTTDGTTPTGSSTLYTQPFSTTSGTTIKAICVPTSGILYTQSVIATKDVWDYNELEFIHNATMSNNSNVSTLIDTGIQMDNTIELRYKGKNVGYTTGNVSVGNFTSDSNDLRLFMMSGNTLYLDWGGSRLQGTYNYTTYPNFDFTVNNMSCYDNNTQTYIINGSQGNYTLGENLLVDCTTCLLQSLQVWKTINNVKTLVFDGVAAEVGGDYGLFDRVGGQLVTNSNITIVGESYPLYFEDRSGAANTITCTKTGSDTEWLSLQYSTDKQTWSSYDLTQTLTIPANGRIYLKGSNTYGFGKAGNTDYHTFTCSGNYALGGDLFSIMDSTLDTYPSRFGRSTFAGSTTLVDISQLVFGNKKIDTTTFTWMFQNCTSLVTLPNEIGVSYPSGTDLLTSNSQFTQMFQSAAIGNFPKLTNITAIGKNGMYRIAQTSLSNNNLEYLDLSNITTLYSGALHQAFSHCSALEVIKIGISAWPDFEDSTASDYNATYQWLNDVSSTGVFCKNSTLPVTRGVNYIPNNWSIADLNGKLYDPVITESNGDITIAEGGGGSSSTIYYTTDGSDPDTTSNVYSGTFSVASGTVVKAFADYTPTGSGVPQITHSNIVTHTVPQEYFYFEDRSGFSNTITCTKTGSQTEWLNLQYSTDGQTWSSYDLTQTLTIPGRGRVYLRGSNTYGFGKDVDTDYHRFTCSGKYALGGDLFTIMDSTLDNYPSGFGRYTFLGSTTLVDISQLVFGNRYASSNAFIRMFENCTSLVTLPNEIGVSYPSTIDFSNDNSHFYQMFKNDLIANFPKFPNITAIANQGMSGIAYLPEPENNGASNNNYEYVDLSNITTLYRGALHQAFAYCSALEVVKIGISAWPDFEDSTASDYNATYHWLRNYNYTSEKKGVFCKNSTLPVTRGVNYIPNSWSIADLNGKLYAPEITYIVISPENREITITEGGGGTSSTIYYTTDGSDPDTTSNVYFAPFSVASGTVIKAFADYTPTGSNVPFITHSNITTYTVQ